MNRDRELSERAQKRAFMASGVRFCLALAGVFQGGCEPARPDATTVAARSEHAVWFADPARRQERAFQVPDWARLETVRIAGDGKTVTLRFAAERPAASDGSLWAEVFLWPDESQSGDQAALYFQIAGEPLDPALKGRVKAGEAVVWHKGGEVRVVRLAFAGPSVLLESEGWKPERAVLHRAYAFWLPREAKGWVAWTDRSPTVGSYARPSDVLMEAVRTFSGVAGTSLERLPLRS